MATARENARANRGRTDSLSPSRRGTWVRFFHGAYVTLARSRCRYQLIPSVSRTERETVGHCNGGGGCRYTLACLDTTTLDYAPADGRSLVLYRGGTCRSQWSHRVTPSVLFFSLFLRPRSASSSIDTVSRPYERTPTRPCEIPKANKRSNAKKHLFPILYLTLLASLPFFILLAAVVSLDAHACPGRACLSRVYPWASVPFPLLLLPEINEIARRYDRYGRTVQLARSVWLRCSHTRFH